ncbi:ABC transporter permease [Catenulispora sp. NL8]|uniref:ABC transporter permease n=1 Tax=Catenulispora pinistramenti TaxID=2705254 RepID=A0ABS5KLE6_9ACTN|nr:ABC transporter permease [Catenulispora pinistramenti]MBS2546863.1 ABC transporter permease [Catenulispora pinistramenti]
MATATSETASVEEARLKTPEPPRPAEQVHVFEPYRYALPKLGPYFRDVWSRRQFATHMASSTLKGQHFDSFFGQFWLVLNPMLLALVYFLLTSVLGGQSGAGTSAMNHFVGLLTGLFAFFYTRNVIQFAASSITGGGKMIINMSFPKVLLPLSTTFTAMLMYFPTLLVYAVFYVSVHHSVTWNIFWIIPIFLIQTVFSFGLGLLFAAVTLYFRDMSTLLPYVLRIWMYITPVLFSLSYVKSEVAGNKLPHAILAVYNWDPFSPIINSWNTVLVGNGPRPFWPHASYAPQLSEILVGAVCAVLALVIGAWYFMSREREFAVRL